MIDLLYGVAGQVKRFREQFPEETVLAAGGCKAVRLPHEQEARRDVHWVTSRRGVLIASDRRLRCGDWEIPVADVERASSMPIPTLIGGGGLLLKVTTREGVQYQFGLMANVAWTESLPFEVTRDSGQLRHSPFSVAVRVLVVGWIVWTLGGWMGAG